MVIAAPTSLRLRVYQVGFGECILITITYDQPLSDGRSVRNILIDFGSKVLAEGGPNMEEVAELIVEHCGGVLDAVAVTHRHQDHLGGFGNAKAQVHLAKLEPKLILRPWTDIPEKERTKRGNRLGKKSRGFLALLDTLEGHTEMVAEQFALDRRVLAERARELAELGISNTDALAMLDTWVPKNRTQWIRAGDQLDLTDLLPGVGIEVLGPPTLEDVPGLASYASSSKEYWLGLVASGEIEADLIAPSRDDNLAESKAVVAQPDGLARPAWLLYKLRDQAPRQILNIVEGFEDVLNNTSLVLLLTVGKRTLLLAGDAQVENWSYALDRATGVNKHPAEPDLLERLANVDVYKVGHHGSRNATPVRLYEFWRDRRRPEHALMSVMSTKSKVYGSTTEGKVPKPNLLKALGDLGKLHSTEQLKRPGAWWFDVEAPTSGDSGVFRYTRGPRQS